MQRRSRFLALSVVFVVLLGLLMGTPVYAETLMEKVKEFDLKNGMKFLVVERHEAPVVFCAIVFDVGSANERNNITGISHLLEHMMFKGTEMMGTKNYKKEIPYIEKTDELGERTIELRKAMDEWRYEKFRAFANQVIAGFSDEEKEAVGANKYEQNRLMAEKIRAMSALPDSLTSVEYLIEDRGVNYLEMFVEHEIAWGEISKLLDEQRQYIISEELWEYYMNNGSRFLNAGTSNDFTVYFVYLPANRLELWMTMESDRMDTPIFREFWSERDVVMEERRLSENDPDDVLRESFYSVAFTASPYKWPVLGWMSDLLTVDREELVDYHRIHYAPNNAVAVVVGDIDVGKVKKMAKKYFGPIPAQEPPPPVETREPEQQGERRVVVEHTANPRLMIGFHKPTFPHPDAVTTLLVNNILSEGRTSRLYKSIYEEQELTARPVRVYTGPGDRYDNLLVISAMPQQPHTLEEVEAAILDELEKLKTEPVTDRELQRIKNQIDAMQIRQLGSNLGIAFTIAMGQLYLGDYKGLFELYDRVKAVTKEDVMRYAEEYFMPKNRTVGYRVKVEEEEDEEGGGVDEEAAAREVIMKYVQSLSQDEQMQIYQKFQQLRSPEEQKAFGMELYERAKAAGFVKEKDEKKEEKQ
ncbi:MAG: insulinase family protein [bacterium]|nr:MAG: insulinase family protein [bacterium]